MLDQSFPPQAQHPEQIAILLEAFGSVIEARTAFYVSSPLTTGQRAFEWHLQNGGSQIAQAEPSSRFRREVIEPNREQTARYVRDLRKRTERVVIDPTALQDLPGWTQADYRVFWGRIIERYAETVVFRDGWQYSSGCAYEFLVALESGAHLLREDLTALALEEGKSFISRAIDEARKRGASDQFLQGVREALREGDTLGRGIQ